MSESIFQRMYKDFYATHERVKRATGRDVWPSITGLGYILDDKGPWTAEDAEKLVNYKEDDVTAPGNPNTDPLPEEG